MNNKWIVDSEESGTRLLTFVKKKLHLEYPPKDIEWAIEHNLCYVNAKVERFCSHKLKKNDEVVITVAKRPKFAFEKSRVLYEDDLILAYNKPSHIPTTGENSLESVLCLKAAHRLDRDTTGVILFAKTGAASPLLENLFRKREIKKTYLALVWGHPLHDHGIIENYLGKISQREGEVTWGVVPKLKGLFAKTEWHIEKKMKDKTLLRCTPLTGRTHQIRIHLRAIGHSIVGDLQYAKNKTRTPEPISRPLLHASSLEFLHPQDKRAILINASLPEDFEQCLSS